jgi:hypothetical protein
MIGYRISKADLEKLIEDESDGWLDEAKTRTAAFKAQGYFEEKSSIWSKVKVVYMRLQGDCKCAFCERQLEWEEYGKGEQDVEHFRPKKNVKAWKAPKVVTDAGIKFAAAPSGGKGYYLLPYHPFNYTAACKPCNSALKSDYFPIAGKYNLKGVDPAKLKSEKPYLIFPIGDFDDDPGKLIKFHGLSPQPVAAGGHDYARALVTIHFFQLADLTGRKNLFKERAKVIIALHPQLEKLADGVTGQTKADAQDVVDSYTLPSASHANCARSYVALHKSDRAEAKELFDYARSIIRGGS